MRWEYRGYKIGQVIIIVEAAWWGHGELSMLLSLLGMHLKFIITKSLKINKIQKETDESLPLIVTNFTPRTKCSLGTNHKTKIIGDIFKMLKEQAVFDLNRLNILYIECSFPFLTDGPDFSFTDRENQSILITYVILPFSGFDGLRYRQREL